MATKKPLKAQNKKAKKTPAGTTGKTAGKPSASKPTPSKKTTAAKKTAAKGSKAPKTAKAVKTTAKKTLKPAKPAVTKSVPLKSKKTAAPKPEPKETKKLSEREKEIQGIKKKLLMQKSALLSEAEVALNCLPGQTIFPDLGDQASAEIDRNFMLRLRGREQRLIKKIEEAIEKIDTGSFGTCEVCGQEIDIKRLFARPVTTMCIFCKIEQEEEERLRGT